MPISFAAPIAEPAVNKPKRSGLIGDRLCTVKVIAANGKSFITAVNVKPLGGLGAAIGHRQSLVRKMAIAEKRAVRQPSGVLCAPMCLAFPTSLLIGNAS